VSRRCPQGARNPFHTMQEGSAGCMTVHSPATRPLPTTDDPDDAEKPVATGQEDTQCTSRTLGAGVGERTRTSTGR
jgi:hypothetical protein